jgi:hypothetical protein
VVDKADRVFRIELAVLAFLVMLLLYIQGVMSLILGAIFLIGLLIVIFSHSETMAVKKT